MKIHLQVVLAAIAPPTIGPTRRAKALVTEMLATNFAYFSGGTRSKTMIVQREKHPPPPMPWKARRMMLSQVSPVQVIDVSSHGLALQLCQCLGGSAPSGEDDEDGSGQQENGLPAKDVTELGENDENSYRGV